MVPWQSIKNSTACAWPTYATDYDSYGDIYSTACAWPTYATDYDSYRDIDTMDITGYAFIVGGGKQYSGAALEHPG